jgi:hypothetical protein
VNNKLLNEKPQVTKNFKKISKTFVALSFSSLFSLVANNFDRLLIFPILGFESVTIISISTLI